MRHWFMGAALTALTASCLPGDDRPPPGSLFITSEPSERLTNGFVTRDGWTITFERFLTSIGDIRLRDAKGQESCTDYSATRYEWLYDFTQFTQPQKSGIVYGLGTCDIEFSVRSPSFDTVLGEGATQEDLDDLTIERTDAYAEDEDTAMLVIGRATRGDVVKTFNWRFLHDYEVMECLTPGVEQEDVEGDPDAEFVSNVQLNGNDELTRAVVIRGEELFRASASDDAALLFGHYAAADSDQDGEITLEELEAVEVEGEPFVEGDGNDEEPFTPETLGEQLYLTLLPRVGVIAGGSNCVVEQD